MNSCDKNGGAAICEKSEGGLFKHPPARRGLSYILVQLDFSRGIYFNQIVKDIPMVDLVLLYVV